MRKDKLQESIRKIMILSMMITKTQSIAIVGNTGKYVGICTHTVEETQGIGHRTFDKVRGGLKL